MAKPVKEKYIGARVDQNFQEKVTEYTWATDMNMGDLVRVAISEFMLNHPIKMPVKQVSLKPGEEK